MDEVLEYIVKKHMTYKLSDGANGKEAILMTCPYCKDSKYHFYFNLTNKVFYCHKCNHAGSLFTLKSDLGDVAAVHPISPDATKEADLSEEDTRKISEAHANLLYDKETCLYVADRNFSSEAIEYFRLGMSEEEGYKWFWMPYIDAVGMVKNVKKRSINKDIREFRRWVGRDSILFNERALTLPFDHIIICEGESDTIALWSIGIKNVVGVPTGAKGINATWVQQLDKYQRIYIMFDNDQAGYDGASVLGHRLGIERCYRIELPPNVKDANEYTKKGHSEADFLGLIEAAKLLDVQYVNSVASEMEKYIRAQWTNPIREKTALELPWKGLQDVTDGFVPGDLIILASRPGVGKSTMGLNLLYKYSAQGIPTLLFSLEMGLQRLLPRFVALQMQMDSRKVSTFETMQKAYTKFKDMPLYLAYVYKKPSFDFVADTIRMCIRRYGIKFVVFDNLHFLVRSLNDQTKEVSVIINNFKLLAEELSIPILVIARPRKTPNRVISNLDLKDSADIEGDADIIILLHREPKDKGDKDSTNIVEGIFEPKCLTRVSKCRYAAGGDVYLHFQDDTCTITEWGK